MRASASVCVHVYMRGVLRGVCHEGAELLLRALPGVLKWTQASRG